MSRTLVAAGGMANLLFAAFHMTFPWLFRWQEGLISLSTSDQSIFYTLHSTVILVLLAFAYCSLFQWRDMLSSSLGRSVAGLICLLWCLRASAEIISFRIGLDGAWWRVALFLAVAIVYLPAVVTRRITVARDLAT